MLVLSYRVTPIRDWENVFVITGFPWPVSGSCSTSFTLTGAKDIVRFPGVVVLWGFVISGSYRIRRKSTRLEKSLIHNAT